MKASLVGYEASLLIPGPPVRRRIVAGSSANALVNHSLEGSLRNEQELEGGWHLLWRTTNESEPHSLCWY